MATANYPAAGSIWLFGLQNRINGVRWERFSLWDDDIRAAAQAGKALCWRRRDNAAPASARPVTASAHVGLCGVHQ